MYLLIYWCHFPKHFFFKTHSFTLFLYYLKTVVKFCDIFVIGLFGYCHKNKKSMDIHHYDLFLLNKRIIKLKLVIICSNSKCKSRCRIYFSICFKKPSPPHCRSSSEHTIRRDDHLLQTGSWVLNVLLCSWALNMWGHIGAKYLTTTTFQCRSLWWSLKHNDY